MKKVLIDNVDYSKYAVFPLKIQRMLDESLDQGTLTLKNLTQAEPFEPMTKVVIDDNITFLIAVDNVTKNVYGKNERFQHDLLLIEETKELEKFFVDTCTFTNSIFKQYLTASEYATPIIMNTKDAEAYWEEYTEQTGITPNLNNVEVNNSGFKANPSSTVFKTPIITDASITSVDYGMATVFGIDAVTNVGRLAFRIYDEYNNLIRSYMAQQIQGIRFQYSPEHIYRIEVIALEGNSGALFSSKIYGARYYVVTLRETSDLKSITITDVVNRLLAICETKRVGETPRFVFNAEQAEKYSNVLAPEFSITKSTLREALKQVGSYIHAEPRLVGNTIYFDDLGGTTYAKLPTKYTTYTSTQDIEQFCSEIDCNVDNMVNIDDEQSGTIIEPFLSGLKTTRTDIQTVDIRDTTAFIETTKPIEKIIKVEFGFLNGNTDGYKDITPYIYEQSEYSVLSSYSEIFPYSKAYGLYYKQGEKNIYGLNFENAEAGPAVFRNFAIINILNRVYNTSVDAVANPLAKMQFRVTYIPVISSRIKQRKPYLNATKRKSVLAYNASANKVDTDYYGENLKGAVARLGNIEKTLTYCVKTLAEVPKAGMLFDKDYYISAVKTEILPNYIRFTIGLSKDFNRWNEYVGINNNQRFYEVSEKQSVERYIVYEDYLIVGDSVAIENNEYDRAIGTEYFMNWIYSNDNYPVTAIAITAYDKKNNKIGTNTLPCISFALGNSAVYQVSYLDNFGAGTYVQQYVDNALGFQSENAYGDAYGNIERIKVDGYYSPLENAPSNFDEAVDVGSQVPNITPTLTVGTTDARAFTTGNADIIIKKDSREIIHFAYQIHCVTNKENIIVGSGLPKRLSVSNNETVTNNTPIAYIMDRQIGKFEKEILDLPNESDGINVVMVNIENKQINFNNITCNKSGNSVIIVDRKTNELLFAINTDVKQGQTFKMPSLMLRHKIYS